MAGINVKITGFKELAQRIAKAKGITQEVDRELALSAERMRAAALAAAPSGVGNTLKSGIGKAKISEMNYSVFSNANYSGFIEFGTKSKTTIHVGYEQVAAELKGQKGGTFEELVQRLTKWVRIKGITGTYSVKTRRRTGSKRDQAVQDKQAAYAIAVHIVRYGINAQPFFFKQLSAETPVIIKNLENILQRV